MTDFIFAVLRKVAEVSGILDLADWMRMFSAFPRLLLSADFIDGS